MTVTWLHFKLLWKQQTGSTMTTLASAAGMLVQNWYWVEKEFQVLAEPVFGKIEVTQIFEKPNV